MIQKAIKLSKKSPLKPFLEKRKKANKSDEVSICIKYNNISILSKESMMSTKMLKNQRSKGSRTHSNVTKLFFSLHWLFFKW
jgi:hypothetical protein